MSAVLRRRETGDETEVGLAATLGCLPMGVVLLDDDLAVTFANAAMAELVGFPLPHGSLGMPLGALIGQWGADARELVPDQGEPQSFGAFPGMLRERETGSAYLDFADGRTILCRWTPAPNDGLLLTCADISWPLEHERALLADRMETEIRFNNETLEQQGAYLASLAEDAAAQAKLIEQARRQLEIEIAERKHLEAELRRMATTDALTGAFNRAEFLASGRKCVEQSAAAGEPLAVHMFDVDHFKQINDRYGHAGGDQALIELVATIRATLGQHGQLGRLGGEEFAVVLPGVPLALAVELGERCVAAVAAQAVRFNGAAISMTISAGLAMSRPGEAFEALIARADAALYQAKHLGRNRLVVVAFGTAPARGFNA